MKNHVKLELNLEVDQNWIEFVTRDSDLFLPQYCGYWMYGLDYNKQGWLAYEHNEAPLYQVLESPEYLVVASSRKKKLPPRWFRLDKKVALQAWIEGVKLYGLKWFDNADALTYDVVMQMTLLKEVRYG
jgi:hypothetical protein